VTDDVQLAEGLKFWRTKKGWAVLQIHYTADPDKRSPEWKQAAMDSMPDRQSFNREFEIDWTSTTGLPFYQLFYEKYVEDRAYFIRPQEPPPSGAMIYRGFDFGFRKPACLWVWQSADGICRVLREFCPENIDVFEFRDAVRYLSGEIALDDKTFHNKPRAVTCINSLWEHPFFPKGTSYQSFCGIEAKHVSSITGDHGELNDFEVFEAGSIPLQIVNQRVSAGTYIIRRLMKGSAAGTMLQVDPRCNTLISGLAGGLTFGVGTKATPLDDEVAVHPDYSHIHDALRYVACGVWNVADVEQRVNERLGAVPQVAQSRNPEPPRYGPSVEAEAEDMPFWATAAQE